MTLTRLERSAPTMMERLYFGGICLALAGR
jgi:hypothetical protein